MYIIYIVYIYSIGGVKTRKAVVLNGSKTVKFGFTIKNYNLKVVKNLFLTKRTLYNTHI